MQKLIFIVDDSDANLTIAASALENEYRVLTMLSAQKMFALLEKKRPDLILLDIEMPQMSGFEAIAVLKENPELQSIPVVFATSWTDEKTTVEAEKWGAPIMQKPIVPSILLNYVKKYI